MESDKQLFQVFSVFPGYITQWMGRFIGCTTSMRRGEELKAILRRPDGYIAIEGEDMPLVVLEFQMQKDANIYNRTIMEMSMLMNEDRERKVVGVIIYLTRSMDPSHHTWGVLPDACPELLQVLYLDEEVKRLDLSDPLRAVFEPFLNEDLEDLRSKAPDLAKTIRNAPLTQQQSESLENVFISWMMSKFANLSLKEVYKMIGNMTPLRETVAGKEVYAEGLQDGEMNGYRKGEIDMLNSLLSKGLLKKEDYDREIKSLNGTVR